MNMTVAIAAGGAFGALFRYWMSIGVHKFAGSDFPYGTLTVNVAGSLLMGALYVLFKVHGVTVFRGITGFGRSGRYHSSTLMDMSLDLPVVIEFFESPDRATAVIEYLNTQVEPGHIVFWNARMNATSADGRGEDDAVR